MKAAILSNLFPPDFFGGAEEAARAQAQKMRQDGDDVFIITLSPADNFSVQEKSGLKIYYLKHKNIFNYCGIGEKPAWLRFLWHIMDTFNFRLANDIKKILARERPDLIICHNLKGLSYLTPLKIKKLKIKNYAVIHDVSLYTPSGLIEWGKEDAWEHTGFLTRIYRFFTRRLFSFPEKVFFPSKWLLNFYEKNGFFTGQEKIFKPNDIIFEEAFGNQPSASNNFLFVGKLERHKGIMFLLDVFKKIDANLDIIGDGSLMPQIKNRAAKNPRIIIHGRIPRGELPNFYSRAKAVIAPSLVYENAPNVVYEAIACGAPVIVSALGGAGEAVREGENGWTFKPGNAEDLAEKIKKYLG